MLQLLEKPFNLEDLSQAVASAVETRRESEVDGNTPAIPVLEVERDGSLPFVSERARQLLQQVSNGQEFKRLQDVFGGDIMDHVGESVAEWVSVDPTAHPEQRFQIRSRWRGAEEGAPWLVVVSPESEPEWTSDPRVRLLLDHRSRSQSALADPGPVVMIERDGALRRLLMTQIERIGALCYPADDLASALGLLKAEPRARTVLLDLELADDELDDWMSQIKAVREDVRVIGTGASDASEELRLLGIECVLPKPWRIIELLDALST